MITIHQCDLCGNKNQKTLFQGGDRFHDQEGVFKIVECTFCGLIYLTPRPESAEIERYYPEDYISYPIAIEDEISFFRRIDRSYGLEKRCRQIIRRVGDTGRLLDIGCATGIFLNGMKQRGWKVSGVEPNHRAADYARNRFNLEIENSYLEEAAYKDDTFDVVTMWDVLEHVPSPTNTLKEISRILKPDGWLVLSLPNPNSWDRKWFKEYWAGWDIPRHFHLFPIQTLENYLNQVGIQTKEIKSFTQQHGMLALSITLWVKETNAPDLLKTGLIKFINSIPARLLTRPFYFLTDRYIRSSTMVVFGQKTWNQKSREVYNSPPPGWR